MDDIEKAAVSAFMQLALKLNEATFRPLFLRLIDWTTTRDSTDQASSPDARARQFTLFKVLDRMLIQLQVRTRLFVVF